MKNLKFLAIIGGIVLSSLLTACGQIETGNVGVRTQFGKVQAEEETPGVYTAILSNVDEYTTKETYVSLDNLTPRAKDNLTLKDLDVTIYYKTNPTKIAEFVSSHAGMSAKMQGEHFIRPGYVLIENLARGAAYDETSKFDSLTLHQNRQDLESAIKDTLNNQLSKSDPGYFEITRVVIRSITTDPQVEESIRKAVAKDKELEAARKEVQVKAQEAAANNALAASLTEPLLKREYIQAISKCAENSNCTLILGGGNSVPLINLPK